MCSNRKSGCIFSKLLYFDWESLKMILVTLSAAHVLEKEMFCEKLTPETGLEVIGNSLRRQHRSNSDCTGVERASRDDSDGFRGCRRRFKLKRKIISAVSFLPLRRKMSSYTKESVSDKASNAVSDATNGTVGNPTLLHQTVNLASHTIDFAKGVVGIGGSPASGSSDVIHGQHGVQHSQTLGSLINESRDLAANIIGATRDVTK